MRPDRSVTIVSSSRRSFPAVSSASVPMILEDILTDRSGVSSIAVHVPAADAAFVGDALTTRHVLTGHEGAQPAPFTDEPAEAPESLDRGAEVQAS